MTIRKTGFLKAAMAAGWPEKHVAALTNFFWSIENHPILEREHGQAILLRFQAQTRRWWHEDLPHPRATKWNIGKINENAIETVARKYYAEKQDLALTKVSNPSQTMRMLSLTNTPRFSSMLPTHAAPLPHHPFTSRAMRPSRFRANLTLPASLLASSFPPPCVVLFPQRVFVGRFLFPCVTIRPRRSRYCVSTR